MRAIVLISLLSLSCYQTTTSNERTVRTNQLTGRSEVLARGSDGKPVWREVREATPTAQAAVREPKPYWPLCPAELEGAGVDAEARRIERGCASRTAPMLGKACPDHMTDSKQQLSWGCTPPGASASVDCNTTGLSSRTREILGIRCDSTVQTAKTITPLPPSREKLPDHESALVTVSCDTSLCTIENASTWTVDHVVLTDGRAWETLQANLLVPGSRVTVRPPTRLSKLFVQSIHGYRWSPR